VAGKDQNPDAPKYHRGDIVCYVSFKSEVFSSTEPHQGITQPKLSPRWYIRVAVYLESGSEYHRGDIRHTSGLVWSLFE